VSVLKSPKAEWHVQFKLVSLSRLTE